MSDQCARRTPFFWWGRRFSSPSLVAWILRSRLRGATVFETGTRAALGRCASRRDRRLGSGRPVARFSSAGNAPVRKLAVALRRRASLWLQGALTPPARRTHAHEDAVVHRRPRRVACGLPSLPRPAPSPCLASCTPCKVRRAVWRTHTHSGLPRARGRGDEAASTAATARVRRFSASRHPPRHAHTHTQPHSCTWPTPCAAHPSFPRDMHAVRTREATSVGLRCAFLRRRSTHAWPAHTPTHTDAHATPTLVHL